MAPSSEKSVPQRSPLSGVVQQVHVQVGQLIDKGDVVATVESMLMHVQITSEHTGFVETIEADQGDPVSRNGVLLTLRDSANAQHNTSDQAVSHQIDSDDTGTPPPHPSYISWQHRQALTFDARRKSAIAKRHSKGYRSARENLASLCDPDQFIEYGQLAVAAQRQRKNYDDLKTDTAADGVITGIGSVGNVKTALIINDYTVLAGTQGFFHHQKIDRILAIAEQQQLPVIMFTEGGGGRPGDTDVTVVNSGLQCTSFSTWAGLCGKVPRIAIANGYNFAGNAALFGAADITIATKTSWIGMAGPAMIAGGGLGDFKPTDIGPIDVQKTNGVVDVVVDDEVQASDIAKQLVNMLVCKLPKTTTKQHEKQLVLRNAIPENRRHTYAIRDILCALADRDTWIELKQDYGGSVVTGLMQLGGYTVGILANDCCVLGGAIDTDAGAKAVHLLEMCDDFGLPIISFCDTPGFMVGPEHEARGAVRKLAELFKVGAKLSVPLYAVVLRKCYGLGAQAMLGGSTKRPLATLSWPTGEFGAMGLEGAVALGYKTELNAQANEKQRQALFETLLAKQYALGQATEVASVLELDAVIDPAETKAVLLNLLAAQSGIGQHR